MKDIHSPSVDRLYDAVLTLKTREECRTFFEDLMTFKEIASMAQRLETAEMLLGGSNYQTIGEELGTSTVTISRVSRCLNYGTGGYKMVCDRLREAAEQEEPADPDET